MDIKQTYKNIFLLVVCMCSIYIVIYISVVVSGISNENVEFKRCDVFKSNSSSVFKIPLQKNTATDFQPVSNGTDMFVYSAYHAGGDKIRLIGLSFRKKKPVLCLLRYWNISEGTETVRVVKAYVSSIHQWERNEYTSVYFLCYLCGFDLPDTVSITTDVNRISNIIPVQKASRGSNPQIPFTMCLSPLHGSIRELVLIEWIELHRILGVRKFIIYVKDVSEQIYKILQYFASKGIVELFPWFKSLTNPSRRLHFNGQIGALNDCLYKTKGRSEYVVATDIDEFIIPQMEEDYTWMDMMQRLPNKSSVFLFRNTFFRISPEMLGINTPPDGRLVTESLHFKENRAYPAEDRSKLIGRTDHIVTLDIHEINALCKGDQQVVPVDVGLLHHYRQRLGGMYTRYNMPSVVNYTSTHKYIKPLRERVGHLSKLLNIYYDPIE